MSGVASGCLGHFSWRGRWTAGGEVATRPLGLPPRQPFHPSAVCMIALARRYRPKRFADLLVQDHVAAVLRGAVARGRVGHGYLLTGPRGVGKTTAARILAMALNCPSRDASGDPCGECENCVRIWTGAANLDVIEIDAASNRGVDDARELRERAMYAASQAGNHKVYIVDEAHMLTREAWNALLKILEEPPPGVVFVFATTEPQKIAATAAPVLSRLQRFDFRRIGPAAIRVASPRRAGRRRDCRRRRRAHPDRAPRRRRDARCPLRARPVPEPGRGRRDCRPGARGPRSRGGRALRRDAGLVAERNPAGVFPLIDRLVDAGADLVEFMGGAGEALRALLMLQLGTVPEGLTEALRQALDRYRDRLSPGDLVRMLRLLTESEASVRRSANPRLVVETLLLRWAMMDRHGGPGVGARGRSLLARRAAGPAPSPAPAARRPPSGAPAERSTGTGGATRPTMTAAAPAAATGSAAPSPSSAPAARALARHRGRGAEPQPIPGRGAGGYHVGPGPGGDPGGPARRAEPALRRAASD